MAFFDGSMEGGQSWAEHGTMEEDGKIGFGGGSVDGATSEVGRRSGGRGGWSSFRG